MMRLLFALGFFAFTFVFLFILHTTLSPFLAVVLLDRDAQLYPFTVQMAMWFLFFQGMSELAYRHLQSVREHRHLELHYLPEDEKTILVKSMLPKIYKSVSASKEAETAFLPSLIRRIITVFQTTNSVENASAVLNSSIDLRSHDLDLSYSMIRYIMWAIPTWGFIGTCIGIAAALNYAGGADPQDPHLLTELTKRLAVSFNGTLVALILASVVVFTMHIMEEREERIINRCGQYCLDNLVNRLYRAEE